METISQYYLERLSEVKNYIQQNYPAIKSTYAVFAKYKMSSDLGSSLFIKVYGKSAHDYLVDFRISEAAKMLTEQKLSCKEVSVKVGYKCEAAFWMYFKKKFGTTPKKYQMGERYEIKTPAELCDEAEELLDNLFHDAKSKDNPNVKRLFSIIKQIQTLI